MFSKIILGDNTGGAYRDFESDVLAAVRSGGQLPDELADIFALTFVEVEDGTRAILNWA